MWSNLGLYRAVSGSFSWFGSGSGKSHKPDIRNQGKKVHIMVTCKIGLFKEMLEASFFLLFTIKSDKWSTELQFDIMF